MTDTPENLAKALEVMTFRVAELEAKLEEKDRQLNAYKVSAAPTPLI